MFAKSTLPFLPVCHRLDEQLSLVLGDFHQALAEIVADADEFVVGGSGRV